jgi:hypothetical protein
LRAYSGAYFGRNIFVTVPTPKTRSHHKRVTVVADADSTCFDDVRWSGGVAYATFLRDGYQIEIEMSKAEFAEWADSGSLGGYYNAVLRD